MKKSAGVFISLYLIFTISGITCNHFDSCKSISEICSQDSDCCFQKCSLSLTFQRYCSDNTNLWGSFTSYFKNKEEQTGMCSYNEQKNKVIDEGLYMTYGLNAGHAVLPPGTKVEVQMAGKKLIVTINNQPPTTNNDVILELSKETAKVLNIPNGEKIPCKLFTVSKLEDNEYYKYLKYVLPYLTLFTVIFRILL